MALYMPWLLAGGGIVEALWVSLLPLAILVTNQIIVGGRSGLLATATVVVGWQLARGRVLSYLVAVGLVCLFAMSLIWFPDVFRIEALSGSGGLDFRDLNNASSGRWEQYVTALSQVTEAPWFGAGFGNVLYGDEGRALHNEFLRLAIEGGIPLAVASLFPLLFLLKRLLSGRKMPIAALLSLLAGFVVAQLEPSLIYGNFNISALWWFAFALCLADTAEKASIMTSNGA
jgi:O-antigen ligase